MGGTCGNGWVTDFDGFGPLDQLTLVGPLLVLMWREKASLGCKFRVWNARCKVVRSRIMRIYSSDACCRSYHLLMHLLNSLSMIDGWKSVSWSHISKSGWSKSGKVRNGLSWRVRPFDWSPTLKTDWAMKNCRGPFGLK